MIYVFYYQKFNFPISEKHFMPKRIENTFSGRRSGHYLKWLGTVNFPFALL
jgi:hypothetical protein